jgi:hypothetical protein
MRIVTLALIALAFVSCQHLKPFFAVTYTPDTDFESSGVTDSKGRWGTYSGDGEVDARTSFTFGVLHDPPDHPRLNCSHGPLDFIDPHPEPSLEFDPLPSDPITTAWQSDTFFIDCSVDIEPDVRCRSPLMDPIAEAYEPLTDWRFWALISVILMLIVFAFLAPRGGKGPSH